ncbi:MAG: hypothetical protein JNM25_08345 [Planctomycetes bacterium]|nr:hypothetical protein [Planctomycetota bacterium]
MTTARTALSIAKQRQLDWLLGEVLGRAAARGSTATVRLRPWLAAALLALGLAAAFGTALLRDASGTAPVQDPAEAIDWIECHGPAQIATIPADVVDLKCFDFDDAALVHLPHFAQLQRLDLSGMDVNDRGYAVALKITDAGLAHLNGLPGLRWLSLAGCREVKGEGLRVLENLPQLEHLDLTSTGVESPAIDRLPWLFSLRELSLSYCMAFHGRSLAEVARVAGLRRLELRGCTTLSAADVMPLAKLTQLRHLDLRDCQGRFRGQRAAVLDDVTGGEAPEPPPTEDGIGITDASVAALGDLKLETLLLGGSESLTDAVGATLAKMATLRTLDLSNLPHTTGSLLDQVPRSLASLAIDENEHYEPRALAGLRRFAGLQELGLAGLGQLEPATLADVLAGVQLTSLRLGGTRRWRRDGPHIRSPRLDSSSVEMLARQRSLRRLDLSLAAWVDDATVVGLRQLPALVELDLSYVRQLRPSSLAALAQCRSLRELTLDFCEWLDRSALERLTGLSLRRLDLYGTRLFVGHIREIAKAWPGCVIKLPDGQTYRAPR